MFFIWSASAYQSAPSAAASLTTSVTAIAATRSASKVERGIPRADEAKDPTTAYLIRKALRVSQSCLSGLSGFDIVWKFAVHLASQLLPEI
jgi:hypothetical protein